MDTITISNREIALMAFDRLRKDDRKDSALKLARCMLHGTSISPVSYTHLTLPTT